MGIMQKNTVSELIKNFEDIKVMSEIMAGISDLRRFGIWCFRDDIM